MVRAKGMGRRVKKRSACTSSAKGRSLSGDGELGGVMGGSDSVTIFSWGVGGDGKVDGMSVDAWTILAPKAAAVSQIPQILQGFSPP